MTQDELPALPDDQPPADLPTPSEFDVDPRLASPAVQARYWAAKMNLEIEMAECEDVLRVFETACAPLLAAFPEQRFIKLETLHAMMLDVIWRGQTLLGQMP